MKSQIVEVLAQGPRSEQELAALFGYEAMPLVRQAIEDMLNWGLVRVRGRQIHEGHNVFRWEREYRLCGDEAA